jgi:hypothetical protein
MAVPSSKTHKNRMAGVNKCAESEAGHVTVFHFGYSNVSINKNCTC